MQATCKTGENNTAGPCWLRFFVLFPMHTTTTCDKSLRVPFSFAFRSRGCASAGAPWSFAGLGLVRTDPILVQTILDQEFGGAQSRVI